MNKSLLQKKFRFVMIIAALAFFITIVTPAYIRTSYASKSLPGVIMMWTVLFGVGGKRIDAAFNFSWIAFVGYLSVIILLIICLIRRFVTIDTKPDKKNNKKNEKNNSSIVLDAICMILCLISLVMFILLPITITNTSVSDFGEFIVTRYAWGVTYILAYLILATMFVSSLIVLYAEAILKFKTIIVKKDNKVEAKKDEVKEEKKDDIKTDEKEDIKEEIKEENKEENNE